MGCPTSRRSCETWEVTQSENCCPTFFRLLRQGGKCSRLQNRSTLFYPRPTGVLLHHRMRRLIASVLVLFALAGNLIPLALAATTAPHSCCVRKTHKCHESASESAQLALRTISCCDHNCCRAVTTSRWASAAPSILGGPAYEISAAVTDSRPAAPTFLETSTQSARAPPSC
jgi:hypothetical protein